MHAASLAHDALGGNSASLESLETNAAAGVPSAEYGLGKYNIDQFAAEHPGSMGGATNLIDEHLDQLRSEYPQERRKIDELASALPGHQEIVSRRIAVEETLRLWKSAAGKSDPAAQAELGREYWNEVFRFFFVEQIGGGNIRIASPTFQPASKYEFDIVQTLSWACEQAKDLLTAADRQNWPEAALGLGLMYASESPDPVHKPSRILMMTGCMVPDWTQMRYFLQRSARLGNQEAISILESMGHPTVAR